MPMEPKVIRKSFSKDAGRYNEPGVPPGVVSYPRVSLERQKDSFRVFLL